MNKLPRDCKEVHSSGCTHSGVYLIDPGCGKPFEVYYDMPGGRCTSSSRGGRTEERTSTATGQTKFNLVDLETPTENSGSAWTNLTASPVPEQEPS